MAACSGNGIKLEAYDSRSTIARVPRKCWFCGLLERQSVVYPRTLHVSRICTCSRCVLAARLGNRSCLEPEIQRQAVARKSFHVAATATVLSAGFVVLKCHEFLLRIACFGPCCAGYGFESLMCVDVCWS